MAQKNATPTRAQQESIKKSGLKPLMWTVLKELPSSLIIMHRIENTVKLINK